MKDHQEVIEKFDLVLENSSRDADVQSAESEIKGNEQLLAEFEEHKLLVDGIRYASRKKLLESTHAWDDEMSSAPKSRLFVMEQRWYYAAASIVIIFVLAFVLEPLFVKPENERIIANYYQPYSYGSDVTRGRCGNRKQRFP
ncbi:MAG: hypothetical protein U5K79_03205 [Cyclobacteriaceae bacterium]|nr:hypothetical protein [Cyclobacteriaceae bacterium]